MAAKLNSRIPVLTDEIGGRSDVGDDIGISDDADSAGNPELEALIAELQTQLAAGAFELTDDIMRKAFAEMEASIFEQISSRLRRELPEMIDSLLRARLGEDPDY